MSASDRFIVAVAVAVFRDGRVLAMRRAPDRDAGAAAWEAVRLAAARAPRARPRREVVYGERCRRVLRAAWREKELLPPYESGGGGVALKPGTGGVFVVRLGEEALWPRQSQGRFPGLKE